MYSGCLCLFLFIQTVLSLTLCSVPFPFCSDFSSMASSYESRRPLPKFGEWDVNDPGSADGFTVIFNQARDEKKSGGDSGSSKRILKDDDHDDRKENVEYKYPKKRKWFCCG